MRRLFFALAFLIPAQLFAQPHIYVPPKIQKDTSTFLIFKDITWGPYFTAGYTRQNEQLPDAWHSKPAFAFMFGGTIDGTINKWLGLTLSMLWDSRDLYQGSINDTDNIDL